MSIIKVFSNDEGWLKLNKEWGREIGRKEVSCLPFEKGLGHGLRSFSSCLNIYLVNKVFSNSSNSLKIQSSRSCRFHNFGFFSHFTLVDLKRGIIIHITRSFLFFPFFCFVSFSFIHITRSFLFFSYPFLFFFPY